MTSRGASGGGKSPDAGRVEIVTYIPGCDYPECNSAAEFRVTLRRDNERWAGALCGPHIITKTREMDANQVGISDIGVDNSGRYQEWLEWVSSVYKKPA